MSNLVQYFALQYKSNGKWKNYHGGYNDGSAFRGIPKLYTKIGYAKNAANNIKPLWVPKEDGHGYEREDVEYRIVKANITMHEEPIYASSQAD